MGDDVRQAARALCDYLDKTSGGEEWKGASLVRVLRAALASGERGAPVDRCPACGSPRRDLRGEVDPTVARKWFRLDIKDGPRHFRYECRDPWHAAPAENDAGRGE